MAKPSPLAYFATVVDPNWHGGDEDSEPPLVALWLSEIGTTRPVAIITATGRFAMLVQGTCLTRKVVEEAYALYDQESPKRRGCVVAEH